MDYLYIEDLKNALLEASWMIEKSEPQLTELDIKVGDGDHGYGMKAGFSALRDMLMRTEYEEVSDLYKSAGIELLRTMGGASGVIFGTMFTAGCRDLPSGGRIDADAYLLFFEHALEAIMRRGRAKPGDRTMLDALNGAVSSMRETRKSTRDMAELLRAGASGALSGMEATKNMIPQKGRSKNFSTQALGCPDPGAVSVSIIFQAFADSIEAGENTR